jgi:DHA2 family multidrug resistance protein
MIRGLGMGLLFVPLSNLTLNGLHGKDIQQASGLNNMIRQLGGSIGVAVMGVVLEKTTAQHYNDLISNITSDNVLFLDRLKTITGAFASSSADMVANQARAFGVIYGQVFKQASMITYINIFQVLALILVAIIPVVFMARIYKIKQGEVLDGGH